MRHFFYVIGNGMDDYYEPNKSLIELETMLGELKVKTMQTYTYRERELEEAKTTKNEFFKEYILNKYPTEARDYDTNLVPPEQAMDVVHNILMTFADYPRLYRTIEWFNKISTLSGISKENIHMKYYKNSLVNIFKSYMGFTPLKHTFTLKNVHSSSVISLFEEITELVDDDSSVLSEDSNPKHEIIVFGYSWGGAIVNRLAVMLQRSNCNCSNVHLACFGSTYIAPTYKINKINLLNYMSTSDLAIKANWLGSRFTRRKKRSFFKVIPRFSSLKKLLIWKGMKICAFEDTIDNLKWICMYGNNKPLCFENGKDKRVPYTDITDHQYDKLMECILSYNINTASFSQLSKDSFINSLLDKSGFVTDISMFIPDDPHSIKSTLLIEDLNSNKGGKIKLTSANRSRRSIRSQR